MHRNAAIKATGVTKTYSDRAIFTGLDLTIHQGHFTVLLGKNGSGKSTMLRLIAGLESADVGRIEVLGSDVEHENIERRQKVAFISEQISLDPRIELSAIKELSRPLFPNWDESIFEKFVHAFNLNAQSRFGTLSRGQRIQFFFAIAAASKPHLYLLDEVTSVLDANARFEVMNHLRNETAKGVSVVLATNIAAEAHNFADQILFLLNGTLGLSCSVGEIQSRFAKFRVPVESSTAYIPPPAARPVQLNGDGSVSYLIPFNSSQREVAPAVSDLRGVTIEDLFVYYTGPENKE